MYLKKILFIIAFLPVIALHAEKASMGYLKKDLSYFKYKDTQLAFTMWLDELAKKQNVTLKITYYDDPAIAMKAYKDFQLYSYSLNTFYYLQNMKTFDALTKEYWTIQRGENMASRLLILVPRKSKITNVQELSNKSIALQNDNLLGKMFLQKELLQSENHLSDKHVNYYFTTKDATAVLKTFFHQSDACIVPKSTFDLVAELNPAVKKELVILKESKPIYFSALMLFPKKTSQELMQKFRESIANLSKTKRGQELKDFFKMKNFKAIPPLYMNNLREFYKNYLQLKKRYKSE